jgi:hypothetical protein
MKHSLSQFLFGLKSASAPLRSDFGTLRVKAKLKLPNHNEIITKTVAHYSGNHSDGIDLGTEMWVFK